VTSGVKGMAQKVFGGGGGKKGRGGGKSTNIIEDIDVGVPVSTAYNQWTQYHDFGGFMKGVEGVDDHEEDETKSNWHLKIGPSRRTWQATTTEQIPDRRIVWESQGAKGSTKGVVTFHPLADDLTRVIVAMEYTAAGLFEKTGNMMRLQLRRVRLDLREYKKFITMQAQETGEWRGEIRDGEVVSEGEQGQDDGRDEEAPQAEASEQDEQQPVDESESESEESESEKEEEREPAASGGRRSRS
jgi:uncharacterized membrane protein